MGDLFHLPVDRRKASGEGYLYARTACRVGWGNACPGQVV